MDFTNSELKNNKRKLFNMGFGPSYEITRFRTPRGTKDFLPEEMIKREFVIDIVRKTFERYGFEPFDTPSFESLELMQIKAGEEISRQIYNFQDKGERWLALRFDLTVPLTRVIANNPQLPKPFKRYSIGKVWRYDEPQAGRTREFLQADVDIIGSKSMEAEAECIACAVSCIQNLGFKNFKVRLNNRKIVEGLVEISKIPKERTADVFRILDKLGKIGVDELKKELKIRKITDEQTKNLLKLITIQGKADVVLANGRKLLKNVSIAEEGLKEIELIFENCKRYGIDNKIVLDFSLVRGLDYYTGPVFEISIITEKDLGSVSGGGRYDNLIELFGGRPTPATGISLGLERIIQIMKNENMFKIPRTRVKVFVANINDKVKKDALKIVQQLRATGISCQTDLMNRNLTKQLEYADSLEIPYVIIVGEKELKKKKFKLKDMKRKTEKELSLTSIIKVLK